MNVSVVDVTVTSDDGSTVPVEATEFNETLTRDSTKYTAAAKFEIDSSGVYTVVVATPHTEVVVAPSIVWLFKSSLKWFALAALVRDDLRCWVRPSDHWPHQGSTSKGTATSIRCTRRLVFGSKNINPAGVGGTAVHGATERVSRVRCSSAHSESAAK